MFQGVGARRGVGPQTPSRGIRDGTLLGKMDGLGAALTQLPTLSSGFRLIQFKSIGVANVQQQCAGGLGLEPEFLDFGGTALLENRERAPGRSAVASDQEKRVPGCAG